MNGWILLFIIIQGIFDIIAIVLFYLLKVVTDNQEKLLFNLRDRINSLNVGHIYCSDPDADFCPKVKTHKFGNKKLVRKDENKTEVDL